MNKSKSAILVILIMLISPLVLTGCSKGGKNYNNGVSAFEDGDYKTAAEEFSEAITLNPDSGDYFIAYGDTLLMQENYEEAVNIYNQVITDKDNTIVKQNNKRAYYGKGVAYYNMAEYDKAIKQFDLASSVDELEDLDISVDVLKKPEKINSIDDLNIKKYGVIVSSGYKRGVLLPNIDGIEDEEHQVLIALSKAGIDKNEKYFLERFEVIRHE